MPIALAEYSLRTFASVATAVFQFHSTSMGALEGGRETKDLKVACATLVWYHWLSRTSIRLKTVFTISTYQGLICVLGVHAFLMFSRSSISICDFPIKASQEAR